MKDLNVKLGQAEKDKDDVYTFNNAPRRFASFDLTTRGNDWPRAYMAVLAMAENDQDGGFIELLRQIWDTLDEIVIKALTDVILDALASAGIGAATGAAAGALGGPEAAALGAVVGAVVGFAVSLIMDSLEDDVFEPTLLTPVVLFNPADGFAGRGSRTSLTYATEINRGGVDEPPVVAAAGLRDRNHHRSDRAICRSRRPRAMQVPQARKTPTWAGISSPTNSLTARDDINVIGSHATSSRTQV